MAIRATGVVWVALRSNAIAWPSSTRKNSEPSARTWGIISNVFGTWERGNRSQAPLALETTRRKQKRVNVKLVR